MTRSKTDQDFGESLLSGLEEVASDGISVSDKECNELLRFARNAAATLRRSLLDVARAEREQAQSTHRPDLSSFTLDALRQRIADLLLVTPTFAVQHRNLAEMPREDLESLVEDMESLNQPKRREHD